MLQKKILIAIFIMLQKKTFGQKNFEFHAQVQKCHFGKIERKMGIRKNFTTCPRVRQIQDLFRKKYKKGIF